MIHTHRLITTSILASALFAVGCTGGGETGPDATAFGSGPDAAPTQSSPDAGPEARPDAGGDPQACGADCDGCCSGDTCLAGDSAAACGTGGMMCLDCGAGFVCSEGGCAGDPASRWDIELLDGTVAPKNQAGASWDGSGPFAEPDAYVEIRVGGTAEQPAQTRRSFSDDNTTEPDWNQVMFTDLRGEDMLSYFAIAIFDDDPDERDVICGFGRVNPFGFNDAGVLTLGCNKAQFRLRILQH